MRVHQPHSSTTTFFIETPFRCSTKPFCTYSKPFPATSGSGDATYEPRRSASGRKSRNIATSNSSTDGSFASTNLVLTPRILALNDVEMVHHKKTRKKATTARPPLGMFAISMGMLTRATNLHFPLPLAGGALETISMHVSTEPSPMATAPAQASLVRRKATTSLTTLALR